jgi:hypothetical protein
MPRPTLLVAEPEPRQALSVRKLVLETGKFNVLTAHSTREAIDLFSLFPNVSASVLVGGDTIDCDAIAQHIKHSDSNIAVIFLQGRIGAVCHGSDHRLASDEPEKLLDLIRSILGDPREDDAREQHERTA